VNKETLTLLLLAADPSDARLIQDHLHDAMQGQLVCTCVFTVGEVVEQLRESTFDVILLDLNLPDGQGLETFLNVQSQARMTPILLLTGLEDQTLAVQAVKSGAQDCLVKDEITGSALARAIRYAIERQYLQSERERLSLSDSLTGLYNRRGFFVLANEQLKLLHRSPHGLLLLLCDVDKMKAINDTFGHSRGDQTLIDASVVLRTTFRDSDIIARLEGDEFAIVAIGTMPATAELLQARLQVNINRYNAGSGQPYQLTFSRGLAYVAPGEQATVEDLIQKAEQEVDEQKRAPKKAPTG
jgi:two-component system cell cycle response regulator